MTMPIFPQVHVKLSNAMSDWTQIVAVKRAMRKEAISKYMIEAMRNEAVAAATFGEMQGVFKKYVNVEEIK
jgi:hypothetical protein